jgi:hypothetical protein
VLTVGDDGVPKRNAMPIVSPPQQPNGRHPANDNIETSAWGSPSAARFYLP